MRFKMRPLFVLHAFQIDVTITCINKQSFGYLFARDLLKNRFTSFGETSKLIKIQNYETSVVYLSVRLIQKFICFRNKVFFFFYFLAC